MAEPLATAFGDHIVAAGQFIAARLTKFCARVAPAWQLSGLSGCWVDGRAIRFVPAVTHQAFEAVGRARGFAFARSEGSEAVAGGIGVIEGMCLKASRYCSAS